MAAGYGLIPVTNVQTTGGPWVNVSSGGNEYNELEADSPKTGGATITFDPNGQYELFDELGTPLGTFLFADLPEGFQIIGILNNLIAHTDPGGNDRFQNAPWPSGLHAPVDPDGGMVSWSTSFGWNQDNTDFFTSAIRTALYSSFTFLGNYFRTTGDSLMITNGNAGVTFAPAFAFADTNTLIFEWNDEGAVGPQLGPVTNPVLETTTPTITVTPPTGSTLIEVETPTTTITTNATPGTPVTVVLPMGTTVVTITPLNPGGNAPGNPLIIPIDLDVESGGLVIDMALAPTMQVIGNPSGIYTLIPNQRFDVLYERAAGTTTTQTVQIPRPFGITSYVPEQD